VLKFRTLYSSTKVKEWVELYLHFPYTFMAWCLVKAQGQLHLYLTEETPKHKEFNTDTNGCWDHISWTLQTLWCPDFTHTDDISTSYFCNVLPCACTYACICMHITHFYDHCRRHAYDLLIPCLQLQNICKKIILTLLKMYLECIKS
jgi:hypothetical protein